MVPRAKASGQLSVPPRVSQGRQKTSYRSPSPSSEADDEQSLYDPPAMAGSERGGGYAPGYPGEDTRTTSKKELAGWYSYGWAAEVFVVCGIGSYIPITLEQLARERGLLLSDKKTPCQATFHVQHGPYGPAANSSSLGMPPRHSEQCIIYFLGYEMNTASFAMYTFSLSVLVQALLIVSLTAAADHGRYRKSFLLGCALVGSIATMLFLPIVPKVYVLGALLALISNVCIGMSFVLLNSFLPLLVRYHPLARDTAKREDGEDADSLSGSTSAADLDDNILIDSTAALLATPGNPTKANDSTATQRLAASPQLRLSTEISSFGMGVGYSAGVLVQTLSILIVVLTGSSLFSLRLALFFIGAWWLIFSIPAALWLRPRPGPPLPGHSGRSWLGYLAYAWKNLGKTIMHASRIQDLVLFLCAWFLISDAIATVSGTAILFAKTQLNMKPAGLAGINIVTTTCAIIGAFGWSKLSHVMGLKPSQTVLVCIFIFELIPLYGLLGFIPAVQRLGVLGLQQPWEMYPLGAIYGFVLGGLSSYCRSLYGELIPAGSEAAFYALYAITDKGSSVFGPAIVGAITDYAGQIRPAFIFLAVLIAIPGPLMWAVDIDRGRRDADQLYRELVSHATNQSNDEEEPSI